MRRAALLLIVVWVLGVPLPALAIEPRAGQSVAVTERIADDLYAWGGTVEVTGAVDGDLVAAGGTITLSGPAGGSVLAAGGTVNIRGPVMRTIRAAGGTVAIDGRVGADALLAGGTVSLGRGAEVSRDLAAAGGTVLVSGNVGRHARLTGNRVVIGGSIRGDVVANAESITLLPTARIGGQLRYWARQTVETQAGAQIAGGVERAADPRPFYREVPRRVPYALRILEGLWLLALGLVIVALVPAGVPRVTERIRRGFAPALLAGFLLFVAVPVAAFLIGLTVVGIPLAVVVMLLYAATLYPAQLFVAAWLGDLLLRPVARGGPSLYLAQFIGTVILVIALTVPVAGLIVRLLAVLVGFGALWEVLWMARPRPPAVVVD